MIILPKRTIAPPTPSTDKITLYCDTNEFLSIINDLGAAYRLATAETGNWTPAILGTGGNPTVTYSGQNGRYVLIRNFFAIYHADVSISTISGGSGNLRITLPVTSLSGAATFVNGIAAPSGIDLQGTPVQVFPQAVGGQAYADIYTGHDNAAQAAVLISGLSNGDVISISGFYFVP